MNKVTTELEALQLCKEHQLKIEFKKQWYGTPEHVIVFYGINYRIIGRDLVEAINRLVDLYHTPPCNFDKLDWWEEHQNFYK